jgi:hypothetical protein
MSDHRNYSAESQTALDLLSSSSFFIAPLRKSRTVTMTIQRSHMERDTEARYLATITLNGSRFRVFRFPLQSFPPGVFRDRFMYYHLNISLPSPHVATSLKRFSQSSLTLSTIADSCGTPFPTVRRIVAYGTRIRKIQNSPIARWAFMGSYQGL